MVSSFTARVLSWFMVSLLTTEFPRTLSAEQLSSQSASSTSWCVGFFLCWEQDSRRPFFELHEVPGRPCLQLVQVSLAASIATVCISCSSRSCTTCKPVEALRGSDVSKLLVHCEYAQGVQKTEKNKCLLKMSVGKPESWAKSSAGINQWWNWADCQWGFVTQFWHDVLGFTVTYMVLKGSSCRIYNLDGRIWEENEIPVKMKMREMNCRKMSSGLFQKFLPFHCVLSKNLIQMEPLSIHIILTSIWHETD